MKKIAGTFEGTTMRFGVILLFSLMFASSDLCAQVGISVSDVTAEQAAKFGWSTPRGAVVAKLKPGELGEKAGLQVGDIIVAADSVVVEHLMTLVNMIEKGAPGAQIKLRVLRDGREKMITLTLGVRAPTGQETRPDLVPVPMLDTGGHTAAIVDIAFTQDGKQLISASNDKTVRVWDIATGKTVRIIHGEAALGNWGSIYAMALSPDGRWLAVGGYMHGISQNLLSAIRIYDFSTGKLEGLLLGHNNVVFALAFSADSKRLISGSGDSTAIVWDVGTRERLHILSGHTNKVNAVAINPTGDRMVTGSEDETLRLWDADGNLIAEMSGHKAQLKEHQEPEHCGLM